MTTAAASSCCFAWGILLFVVCTGHLSALGLPLVPPAAHASTRHGLFLAVPTATAIEEVIATGDVSISSRRHTVNVLLFVFAQR